MLSNNFFDTRLWVGKKTKIRVTKLLPFSIVRTLKTGFMFEMN